MVKGLVRKFRGGACLHGIDLDVAAGEIHALVGLNGAGKTTLMRLVLGMLRPDSGTVQIEGRTVWSADAVNWRTVGHLVAHSATYPELTVRNNLALVARLRGVPKPDVARVVDESLEELDLGRYASVRCRVLSDGNRQRVGLAAALGHDPDLIVLDEPTSALDPSGVIRLRRALIRRADRGAAVLVSSHHLDEVARTARRVTVVNHGRVIGTLDPEGLDIERAFFTLVHADDQTLAR